MTFNLEYNGQFLWLELQTLPVTCSFLSLSRTPTSPLATATPASQTLSGTRELLEVCYGAEKAK